MQDLKQERRRHVRTLRDVARNVGVSLVRDDAGREQVKAFAVAIAASGGSASDKARAKFTSTRTAAGRSGK